jgi:hypothetical protein
LGGMQDEVGHEDLASSGILYTPRKLPVSSKFWSSTSIDFTHPRNKGCEKVLSGRG